VITKAVHKDKNNPQVLAGRGQHAPKARLSQEAPIWSLMRPIGAILGSVAPSPLGSGLLNALLAVTADGQKFSTIWIGFIMIGYAVYQVRRASVLTAGEHAHLEPMMQTSHEIVGMIEKEG
jgi:hypothetical protein